MTQRREIPAQPRPTTPTRRAAIRTSEMSGPARDQRVGRLHGGARPPPALCDRRAECRLASTTLRRAIHSYDLAGTSRCTQDGDVGRQRCKERRAVSNHAGACSMARAVALLRHVANSATVAVIRGHLGQRRAAHRCMDGWHCDSNTRLQDNGVPDDRRGGRRCRRSHRVGHGTWTEARRDAERY